MMDMDAFFDEMSGNVAVWCAASSDTGDLAKTAEYIVEHGMTLVSAAASDIEMLWAWLEKTPVRINARFYLPAHGGNIAVISDMAAQINAAFKQGAHGAQVFLRMADLPSFVAEVSGVRDDLFFNRDLSIGIDITEIGAADWDNVYAALRTLRARALVLVLPRDAGNKSDFVGRVYAALKNTDGACDLHFVLGNSPIRMEQAMRLVRSLRPDMAGGVRMFVPTV